MKTIELNITLGLPASGKTAFAKRESGRSNGFIHNPNRYIDMDELAHKFERYGRAEERDKFEYCISQALYHIGNSKAEKAYIDGLFTTNEQYKKIADYVEDYASAHNMAFKIILHYWKEDRESCLWNDRGRRSEVTTGAIRNLPLEEPDMSLFPEKTKLVTHVVKRKPDFQVWIDENADMLSNCRTYLDSCSWSLGGVHGNCWNDTLTHSSAEPQPVTFREFDELLEKICPNITFLQGKRVYNECVSVHTEHQSEYYGGHSDSAFYRCDLEKLYEMLKDWGYI